MVCVADLLKIHFCRRYCLDARTRVNREAGRPERITIHRCAQSSVRICLSCGVR